MIPDVAVEAAAKCTYEREMGVNWDGLQSSVKRGYLEDARAALEAAAPHMLAEAWDEGHAAGISHDFEATTQPRNPHSKEYK